MNRREFLSITAGSAVAAAVPVPVGMARPAPVVVPRSLQVWATAMARAGNPISEITLGQALKVTPAQAHVVMGRLRAAGAIGAPNAAGVARAIRPHVLPMQAHTGPVQADFARVAQRLNDYLRREDPPEVSVSADDSGPPEVSDAARSAE